MKWTTSGVTTSIAELPAKFVRYRMFEREVTISASTFARAHASRTASCRRLSAALGACDMDGGQKLFESGDSGFGVCALRVHGDVRRRRLFDWRRRWRRRGRVYQKFLCRLLEGEAFGSVCRRFRLDLAREVRDRLFEVGIVAGERKRRAVLR